MSVALTHSCSKNEKSCSGNVYQPVVLEWYPWTVRFRPFEYGETVRPRRVKTDLDERNVLTSRAWRASRNMRTYLIIVINTIKIVVPDFAVVFSRTMLPPRVVRLLELKLLQVGTMFLSILRLHRNISSANSELSLITPSPVSRAITRSVLHIMCTNRKVGVSLVTEEHLILIALHGRLHALRAHVFLPSRLDCLAILSASPTLFTTSEYRFPNSTSSHDIAYPILQIMTPSERYWAVPKRPTPQVISSYLSLETNVLPRQDHLFASAGRLLNTMNIMDKVYVRFQRIEKTFASTTTRTSKGGKNLLDDRSNTMEEYLRVDGDLLRRRRITGITRFSIVLNRVQLDDKHVTLTFNRRRLQLRFPKKPSQDDLTPAPNDQRDKEALTICQFHLGGSKIKAVSSFTVHATDEEHRIRDTPGPPKKDKGMTSSPSDHSQGK
ncbi:unnamed protein product [Nesidiocoris tenuis]|uniref:Uncharacterized protein n=1 Tax=Nesidiocoris tenuis TaxID=355587 RepID=A0A6H5GY88_9HEMI|nr:unnamed protein product [Nesidiocoris tenuis]